jgi:hypothetical protein
MHAPDRTRSADRPLAGLVRPPEYPSGLERDGTTGPSQAPHCPPYPVASPDPAIPRSCRAHTALILAPLPLSAAWAFEHAAALERRDLPGSTPLQPTPLGQPASLDQPRDGRYRARTSNPLRVRSAEHPCRWLPILAARPLWASARRSDCGWLVDTLLTRSLPLHGSRHASRTRSVTTTRPVESAGS